MYYKIFLFLICISLVKLSVTQSLKCSVSSTPNVCIFTDTADVFELMGGVKTYDEALAQCATQKNGFLAHPNFAQLKAITEYGLLKNKVWLNGYLNATDKLPQFKYSSNSPYNGTVFYDQLTGRCSTVCPFQSGYYNLSRWDFPGMGVSASNITSNTPVFNPLSPIVKLGYICQYLDTTITNAIFSAYPQNTIPTKGGDLTIYYSPSSNPKTPTSNPTCKDRNTDVTIPYIGKTSSRSYSYRITPATGFRKLLTTYQDVLGDTNTNSVSLFYEPPVLSYFSYSNQQLTIVGENFGNIASDIKVTFAPQNFACDNVVILDSFAISCTVSFVATHLTPITVSVNGTETSVYSIPYVTSTGVYHIKDLRVNWEDAVDMASKLKCGTLTGYVGLTEKQFDYSNVVLIYPPTTIVNTYCLQGYTYLPNSQTQFIYADGPKVNQIIPVMPFSNGFSSGVGYYGQRLKMDMSDGELYNASQVINSPDAVYTTLIQYYQKTPPSMIITSQTSTSVTLKLFGYGTYFSNITITFNGNVLVNYTTSETDFSIKTLPLPNGFTVKDLVVYIDNVTIANNPVISRISPGLVSSGLGGTVEIIGFNFYNSTNFTKVQFGDTNSLLPYTYLNDSALKLSIPPETTASYIVINNQGLLSSPLVVYEAPGIEGYQTNATKFVDGFATFNIKSTSIVPDIQLYTRVNFDQVYTYPIVERSKTQLAVKMSKNVVPSNITLQVSDRVSPPYFYANLDFNLDLISYTSLYHQQPGNITLTGIGFQNFTGLSGFIGGSPCNNTYFINSTTIICYFMANATPNTNGDALKIELYALFAQRYLILSQQVFYYLTNFSCPNNCNDHGVCLSTGDCQCRPQWTLRDCSLAITPNLPPPPLPETTNDGIAVISTTTLDFNIGISHLREIDDLGQPVKYLSIKNAQWQQPSPGFYIGTFNGSTCRLELKVDIYQNSTYVVFAGETILMDANSVKFTVNISQWNFQSPINTLQIIYQTKASTSNGTNLCNQPELIEDNTDGDLTYFQVKTTNSILQARFARRLVLESRISRSVVKQLDKDDNLYKEVETSNSEYNLLTAVVSPSFTSYCIVDPNYSVLVTGSTDETCEGSKDKKWKVPVIVVCSVVGAALVGTIVAVSLRKLLKGRRIKDVVNFKLRKM